MVYDDLSPVNYFHKSLKFILNFGLMSFKNAQPWPMIQANRKHTRFRIW